MRVRVYKPAKSASQAGLARTHQWLVEPELLTPRLPEPIMGWSRAGDTLGELHGKLRFASREHALDFCATKGWDAVVEEPGAQRVQPRNYLDNFRITRPQDEERQFNQTKE